MSIVSNPPAAAQTQIANRRTLMDDLSQVSSGDSSGATLSTIVLKPGIRPPSTDFDVGGSAGPGSSFPRELFNRPPITEVAGKRLPVPVYGSVASLLQTPAGRAALNVAERQAALLQQTYPKANIVVVADSRGLLFIGESSGVSSQTGQGKLRVVARIDATGDVITANDPRFLLKAGTRDRAADPSSSAASPRAVNSRPESAGSVSSGSSGSAQIQALSSKGGTNGSELVVSSGSKSEQSTSAGIRAAQVVEAIEKTGGVAVYLPQGGSATARPEELNDKTTLQALKQYLDLGIPIKVVYVNTTSYQTGVHEQAQARLKAVRQLLNQYDGYKDTKIAAWVESLSRQSGTSDDAVRNPQAVYGTAEKKSGNIDQYIDVTEPKYFSQVQNFIKDLAKSDGVNRVIFDDEGWGIIFPDLYLEKNENLTPADLTEKVTGKLVDLFKTVENQGKESYYSVNGRFTSRRITNQGLDVYKMIDGGLDGLEVQVYRPSVEGFKTLLKEIWADLSAKPATIHKLKSFNLALSNIADDKVLSPEVRATQIKLANEFLARVKKSFGIDSVGISLWPQAYTNYVTGESIRHPDDSTLKNPKK